MSQDLDAAARSWVAHLRAGGVTPWAAWRARPSAVGEVDLGPLPGGQQTELVRRLNDVTRGGTPRPLIEHVLRASAAGRGRPDVVLTQPDAQPERLPAHEIIRVAATVIAEQLLRGAPAASALMDDTAPVLPFSASLGWGAYRVVGDPLLATDARRAMLAKGRPPGGRRPLVFVVGTDAATMFTHAWIDRAVDVGGPGWRPWWELLRSRQQTPARVELAAAAERWAAREGRDRIRIVVADDAMTHLPRRWRALADGLAAPGPERLLSAEAADLCRRTAQVLGGLTDDRTRRRVLRDWLAPTLVERPGPPLRVPDAHRDWVADRARDLHQRLSAAGYPVLGDLGALMPASGEDHPDAVDRPDPERVLDLAVWLLQRLHEEVEP